MKIYTAPDGTLWDDESDYWCYVSSTISMTIPPQH